MAHFLRLDICLKVLWPIAFQVSYHEIKEYTVIAFNHIVEDV